MYKWLVRFQEMDRRWIFLGMSIAIVIPMLFPFDLPIVVDKPVQKIYDSVEELPAGSKVFISADFDPASEPELGPFFQANLHHLFRRDIKVVVATLWPTAPALVVPYIEKAAKMYGREYGKDWVFLGYKDGKELVIKAIGDNIPKTFPKDYKGTALGDIQVMEGLKQAKDFDLILSVSAGFPGLHEYVIQIQTQYNLKMVGACTAVSGPDFLPFYQSGQIKGLSAGMPGSAQYEKLVWEGRELPKGVGTPGKAGLNVLNVGHLFIIILIIMGNIAYFLTRQPKES